MSASPSPKRSCARCFSSHDGRVAYVYDTIAQLDAPKAAFALGPWMTDPAARLARFQALVDVCAGSYREWRLETLPFSKPLHDLAMLLMRMRVERDGSAGLARLARVLVRGVRRRRSESGVGDVARPIRRRPLRSTPRGCRDAPAAATCSGAAIGSISSRSGSGCSPASRRTPRPSRSSRSVRFRDSGCCRSRSSAWASGRRGLRVDRRARRIA